MIFKLEEIAEFQKGFAFKSKDFKDDGVKIVKVSNLTEESIDSKGCVCIDKEKADNYNQYELTTNDIVITTVGSWPTNPASVVGKVIKVPKSMNGSLLNQNAVRVRSNGKIEQKYLYYLLKHNVFREYIIGTAQGSANQASITQKDIKNFEYNIHEFQEQNEIANILSTLDEKIETNNQINKKLEEMAQAIFKQWFVDFEFPNEDGEPYKSSGGDMVESEMGMIPSGWKVVSFLDCIDVLSGGTPKTTVQDYWNGEIPFFTPKDSKDMYCINTEKSLTKMGLNKCNSKLYDVNTVFITARGTVGKISIAGLKMAMNQSCYALIGKNNINQYFVYFQVKKIADELRGKASGSVFDAIVVDTFKAIKILKPQDKQLEYFKSIMESIFSTILDKNFENQRLDCMRNLIIPKLMSGEIRVPLNN